MHYLGQAFLGMGLMGLLTVPGMTKDRAAEANFQLGATPLQPSNQVAACHDRCLTQLSFHPSPAPIANSNRAIQSNQATLPKAQMIEQRNKKIVQHYFDQWRNKTGSFFDLLAPDATWTVSGTGAAVGTFSKSDLIDKVINPTSARLSTQIVPTVRGIWADGDMVIALWDGEAIAKDGKPYRNTYSWFLQMKDGKAIKAIAVLDSREFTELWTRVSPGK